MTKCAQTASDFIREIFSPIVGVLTSEDAESLCVKNDLSFAELIRPFCQLSNEVHIRDPVNPNVVIPIRNFKIRVKNLNAPSPPAQLVNNILSEVVSKSVTTVDLKTRHSLEDLKNVTTPWFEAYRSCFFQVLKPMDHEFIRHILACMIVVSTRNPDPMGAFVSLSGQQTAIQQSTNPSNPYIKWFSANTFKYFVLLHDVSEGHEFKADAVFQSMKSVYGSHTCFLLQINSRAKMLPNAPEVGNVSDPWLPFLYPFDDETLDIGDDDDSDQEAPRSSPGPKTQAEADKEEAQILENFEKAEKMAEELHFSPSLRFQDPLTSMHYNDNLENDEMNDLGPLKPSPPDLVKDIPEYKRRLSQVKLNEYKKCIKQFSYEMFPASARFKDSRKRGQQLTLLDHDRIKTLIYEFCVRGLLPHIEKQMRTFSEHIMSRKGIHRSIFNVTKKWFGGSKSTVAVTSQGKSAGAGISYPIDSVELQQRKLGDLAFLVQHYELAFNSYHAAKREFNNDHAWLYFAGALEMAAISAFMQGPQRSYPAHYFDACISTYLNTCRLPEYATRACLMSTEAFKTRNMFADAAFEFIKLTNEDCDLRSALLLEQAAYCCLHSNPPMIRKYAFHMILAGHRYSKAVQRKHTLRCYTNALNVYRDKNWCLAEDHMNFITGRQCFNLGQLEDSQNALRKLLIYESLQAPSQQASHLREFLAVFKQNMEKKKRSQSTKESSEDIPDLPLPKIDGQSTRVILSTETPVSEQQCDTPTIENPAIDLNRTRTIIAGQYSFRRNYNKNYIQRWSGTEKKAVEKITGSSRYPWRPSIPCLSNATDNSYQPSCMVGETLSVEVIFVNPLRIPLNLLDLHLLWEFTPSEENPEHESAVITNKAEDQPSYITTEVVKNFIVKVQERKPACLSLKFHKTGNLKITGVNYVLSSISVTNAVDEEGKVELNVVQDSTLLTFGVKGQQTLSLTGPRLNNTKKEKTSIIHGKDYRLNPRILPAVPKLQVWMINFPITLLCGEVRMTQFIFKNTGKTAMKNLYISCNRPECFSLDTQSFFEDLNSKDTIYEMLDGGNVQHSSADKLLQKNNNEIVKVPLENGVLLPNAEISIPVWIHGISVPGVHELDYLFYYEPVNKIPEIHYRVMHQTVRIQTLATLNLSAGVRRSSAGFFKSKMGDGTSERSSERCFIGVHIENRSQGSAFPRCVEFNVLQVSCFSHGMKFKNVGKGSTSYQKLRPGEALLMYLKAFRDPDTDTEHWDKSAPTVSHISFSDRLIDGAKSPAMDFFSTAPSAFRIMDSSQITSARIGLVIFWQTSYIDDSCVRHMIYGQTHTGILDDIAATPTFAQQQTLRPIIQTAEYDIIDGRRKYKTVSNQTDRRYPIEVALFHPSSVEHEFRDASVCHIPVMLSIKNPHDTEITIEIKPKNFVESSDDSVDGKNRTDIATLRSVMLADSSAQFTHHQTDKHFPTIKAWISKTKTKLTLQPSSNHSLEFKAIAISPGLYDLNAFDVFYNGDDEGIVIKKPDDETVIRVIDTSQSLTASFTEPPLIDSA